MSVHVVPDHAWVRPEEQAEDQMIVRVRLRHPPDHQLHLEDLRGLLVQLGARRVQLCTDLLQPDGRAATDLTVTIPSWLAIDALALVASHAECLNLREQFDMRPEAARGLALLAAAQPAGERALCRWRERYAADIRALNALLGRIEERGRAADAWELDASNVRLLKGLRDAHLARVDAIERALAIRQGAALAS